MVMEKYPGVMVGTPHRLFGIVKIVPRNYAVKCFMMLHKIKRSKYGPQFELV